MSEIRTYLELLTALDDKPLRLDEGQALFEEGQPANGLMYVVRTGTVVLRSGRKVLETVGPGGILGEMALIDPAPRSATAVAGAGCTVSAVTEPLFHKLVKNVPGLALELMRIFSRRLRRLTHTPPVSVTPRRPAARPAAGPQRRQATAARATARKSKKTRRR
jgi:CRP-like cAMP-binding protein